VLVGGAEKSMTKGQSPKFVNDCEKPHLRPPLLTSFRNPAGTCCTEHILAQATVGVVGLPKAGETCAPEWLAGLRLCFGSHRDWPAAPDPPHQRHGASHCVAEDAQIRSDEKAKQADQSFCRPQFHKEQGRDRISNQMQQIRHSTIRYVAYGRGPSGRFCAGRYQSVSLSRS